MAWSAHIYWHIDYRILCYQTRRVEVNLIISKNSWVRPEKKCDHLLQHEQGHYLIGALCVLEFMRRVDTARPNCNLDQLLNKVFHETLSSFQQMERQYDDETEHRLNFKMQEKWDQMLHDRLSYYDHLFDKKTHLFRKEI